MSLSSRISVRSQMSSSWILVMTIAQTRGFSRPSQTPVVSMFDLVTSSASHHPGTISLVEDLISPSALDMNCVVVPTPISSTEFSGKPFKEFFNAQLEMFNICLGISRKLLGTSKSHYIVSCPQHNFILADTDIAFILTISD